MKRLWVLLGLALPMLGAAPTVVADLFRDWSSTVNGNNGWSYNAGTVRLPLVPNWRGTGITAWAPGSAAPNLSPAMVQAPTSQQSGGLDFNGGDIGILSADPTASGTNGIANVTWTSNVSGLVTISGFIWDADLVNAFDNTYALKFNGVVLTSGTVVHIVNQRAGAVGFSFQQLVRVGDIVEFDIVKPASQTFGAWAGLTLTITQTQLTKILPQLAFGNQAGGGNWYTAIYFTASLDGDVSFPVNFIGNDGNPLNVPSAGGSTVTVNLAAGATVLLEAKDTTNPLVQGYVSTTLPPGVSGYAVFRQSVPGRLDQEAVVPLASAATKSVTLIYDDTSFETSLSIVNLSPFSNTVTVTARGPGGGTINSASVQLSANSKTALQLRDLIDINGRRGAVDFTATSGAVAVLGIRFGGAAFTDIPSN